MASSDPELAYGFVGLSARQPRTIGSIVVVIPLHLPPDREPCLAFALLRGCAIPFKSRKGRILSELFCVDPYPRAGGTCVRVPEEKVLLLTVTIFLACLGPVLGPGMRTIPTGHVPLCDPEGFPSPLVSPTLQSPR